MLKKSNWLYWLLVVLMFCAVISGGCNDDDDDDNNSSTPNYNNTPITTPTRDWTQLTGTWRAVSAKEYRDGSEIGDFMDNVISPAEIRVTVADSERYNVFFADELWGTFAEDNGELVGVSDNTNDQGRQGEVIEYVSASRIQVSYYDHSHHDNAEKLNVIIFERVN